MSEEEKSRNFLNTFEWHKVEPKSEFYDDIERRFFINTTSSAIMIGFGHNTRQLEIIAIAERAETTKSEDPALNALEGEEIEEE